MIIKMIITKMEVTVIRKIINYISCMQMIEIKIWGKGCSKYSYNENHKKTFLCV